MCVGKLAAAFVEVPAGPRARACAPPPLLAAGPDPLPVGPLGPASCCPIARPPAVPPRALLFRSSGSAHVVDPAARVVTRGCRHSLSPSATPSAFSICIKRPGRPLRQDLAGIWRSRDPEVGILVNRRPLDRWLHYFGCKQDEPRSVCP